MNDKHTSDRNTSPARREAYTNRDIRVVEKQQQTDSNGIARWEWLLSITLGGGTYRKPNGETHTITSGDMRPMFVSDFFQLGKPRQRDAFFTEKEAREHLRALLYKMGKDVAVGDNKHAADYADECAAAKDWRESLERMGKLPEDEDGDEDDNAAADDSIQARLI